MQSGVQGGILRRAAGNAGLLLGGKSAAGAMQLATFALAARGLGLHEFGIFSVVVAQVMTLTGLAAFESNQAIIRYGVTHLDTGDRPAIQALFRAGTLLDLLAAAAAALATVLVAPILGHRLGWDAHLILLAQLAAPLSFANAISTPKGMLRLFGRFDLLTAHTTVTPAARLAAIAVLALGGASLGWYIAAWVAAGWIGAAVAFFFAWREAHRRELLAGFRPSVRGLSAFNQGVWRFSILTNLNSSLALIPTQLAVVIVGAMLGASDAGLFRIAREFATGMIKPVDLINQALYPDLARLVVARDWRRLRRSAVRAGLAAGLVGAAVTLVIALFSGFIIAHVFGRAFLPAAALLIWVAAAAALRSVAFPADPTLYALGRPQLPLLVSLLTSGLFTALLVWRLPIDGLIGAAWAFMGMAIAGAALSSAMAFAVLRREQVAPAI